MNFFFFQVSKLSVWRRKCPRSRLRCRLRVNTRAALSIALGMTERQSLAMEVTTMVPMLSV